MRRSRLITLSLTTLTVLALVVLGLQQRRAARKRGKHVPVGVGQAVPVGIGQVVPVGVGQAAPDDQRLRRGWVLSDDSPQVTSTSHGTVDYNRDIKPILSTACYACHGPSRQRGKVRLDQRTAAVRLAIVPGNAAASPLIARISSPDAEERMPPPEAKKPALTPTQIALLRRWIDEGARYDEHWSFVRPVRPPVPAVKRSDWGSNPVDAFIAAEHEEHRLSPAPEADRRTLLRRLCLDVTGLPPTPEETERFAQDPSPDAYERVVDELLASPRYGERMAVVWLDLVRYADTEGYSVDADRRVSMYRDFVLQAFNQNRRFDEFTIQQVAGDLLPQATDEDRIGSGYNRLLMNSQEGCAEPEERRARYNADRVRNVSSVWLGLTMGCCECHDHKFDPLTTKEFYRLGAFFADIQESVPGAQGLTLFLNAEQKPVVEKINRRVGELNGELVRQTATLGRQREKWEARLRRTGFKGVDDNVQGALRKEAASRTAEEVKQIEQYYQTVAPELADIYKRLKKAQTEYEALEKTLPATLVTTSGPRRDVRVLPRGNWQDTTGEVVVPGLPGVLLPRSLKLPESLSRLDLARWLVSPQNPLTARILANRLWKIAFGNGLVTSVDDFGTQGALPTHPALLDWLAVELVERDWDVKGVLRLLLTSRTYRQSSAASPALQERDPANAWLARQNRFRLDAEFIRDNALAISGLLVATVGGESVKPYQPEGYWTDRFQTKTYQPDTGTKQHRRGLYTFWCRNYLHPSLLLFDAPPRQSCTGQRPRSATPLQALALLNDPSFGEAARAFAHRLVSEAPPLRFRQAYRLALSRDPTPAEEEALGHLLAGERKRFQEDARAASALAHPGDPVETSAAEFAAWVAVARVILNLRETMTRY